MSNDDDDKATTRTRGTGGCFKIKGSRFWYIKYGGRRQSTGTTNEAKAEKILRQRLGDLDRGIPTGPAIDSTTYADLAKMILDDYEPTSCARWDAWRSR